MIAFWLFFADGRIYLSPIHGSVPISSSAFLAAYVLASFLATLQMVSFLRHLFPTGGSDGIRTQVPSIPLIQFIWAYFHLMLLPPQRYHRSL